MRKIFDTDTTVAVAAAWLGLCALAFSGESKAGCLQAPDNSGGRSLHIVTSMTVGAVTSYVARDYSVPAQFALAMIPGIAKEAYDCHSYGLASRQDLMADAIGVALGLTVGNMVIVPRYLNGKPAVSVAYSIPLN